MIKHTKKFRISALNQAVVELTSRIYELEQERGQWRGTIRELDYAINELNNMVANIKRKKK